MRAYALHRKPHLFLPRSSISLTLSKCWLFCTSGFYISCRGDNNIHGAAWGWGSPWDGAAFKSCAWSHSHSVGKIAFMRMRVFHFAVLSFLLSAGCCSPVRANPKGFGTAKYALVIGCDGLGEPQILLCNCIFRA